MHAWNNGIVLLEVMARAKEKFDWSIIVKQVDKVCEELAGS